jgi:hypothetical protein
MFLKAVSAIVLTLAIFVGAVNICFARLRSDVASHVRSSLSTVWDSKSVSSVRPKDDYQNDVDQLLALRSHALDDLIAFAGHLEIKWRRVDWNQYARIMIYVCSEIANRGLNDVHVRKQTEHFAFLALTHSKMFQWEYQSSLVGWFSYQRWSSTDGAWLSERREKAELWLQAWRRLERETDPSFDIKDPKNRPGSRVLPPEPQLLPGSPVSAVKDPRLRAQYQAAITYNQKKSEKMLKQFPLQTQGPSFKARAERVLIQLYSQPAFRITELKQYLETYVKDATVRERILDAVKKNTK